MVLGKKVAIFDWEWVRNSAPRDGQKIPCKASTLFTVTCNISTLHTGNNFV